MAKRITIVFDEDLLKKVRTIQGKIIIKNSKEDKGPSSYSFSRVVNDLLRKTLKG